MYALTSEFICLWRPQIYSTVRTRECQFRANYITQATGICYVHASVIQLSVR